MSTNKEQRDKVFTNEINHIISTKDVYRELFLHSSFADSCFAASIRHTDALLSEVYKINKGAFQSLILRTVAVVLDARYYNDNIRHCKYIWVLNTLNGKIIGGTTEGIGKNSWQYFAAFRTQEDAILAVKVLKWFKEYYGE